MHLPELFDLLGNMSGLLGQTMEIASLCERWHVGLHRFDYRRVIRLFRDNISHSAAGGLCGSLQIREAVMVLGSLALAVSKSEAHPVNRPVERPNPGVRLRFVG